MWRHTRLLAGVQHFVYLTSSDPRVYTADHFRDVRTLDLHAPFLDYLREAFRPLGLYADFWLPEIPARSTHRVPLTLTNDHDRALRGTLALELRHADGTVVSRRMAPFAVEQLGQAQLALAFEAPPEAGPLLLVATATPTDSGLPPTTSRRKLNTIAPP